MLLHLFSDANYNLLGFNATYTFSLCPGACGGHGRCDSSTSKCHCHQGWGGPSCTTPLCTQACSVNGQCDKVRVGIGTIKWTHTKNIYYSRTVTRFSTWLGYSFVCRDETFHICLHSFIDFFQKGEHCLCKPGFVGQNCQLGLYNDSGAGKWWRVSEENPYTPPRTGSAGVYLSSTGAMYLFGGKSNTQLNSTDTIFLLRKTFLTHKTTARFLTLILWYMLIIITQHNLLLCYILTISDVDVFVRAECQCLSHQSHISLLACLNYILLIFFAGFDLNRALGDLIKYNFTSNQWESRSYGHSPVSEHTLKHVLFFFPSAIAFALSFSMQTSVQVTVSTLQ